MKYSKQIAALVLVAVTFFVVGCSSTKQIGQVGDIRFYKVHASQFDGPNFTALVTMNTNTDEVKITHVFGSGGIGTSIIAAGGSVGAAAVLGTSFPKNVGDNISVGGGDASSSSSSASTANASAKNHAHANSVSAGGSGGSGGVKHNHGNHHGHGKDSKN